MIAWPSRLGRPGLAAVLALLVALPLMAWFTPPPQALAPTAVPAAAASVAPAPVLPVLPVLPHVGDPADRVADLLALALRHGIRVDRTQQQRQQQGPVQRLQLGLSAHGRYADLRAFIAAALEADPGLALDSVQLRRATADAPELDAELQWSLLRADATGASVPSTAARGAWPAATALMAWSGPPAPPPPPAVAAPAQAPPPAFPYRWIGRLDDGIGPQALLAGPQRSFGARAGDVLDGRWRVDRVAAARLQLTWLPTGAAVNVDTR